MIKIMFVCHGNICRSPMAEFVMKELVKSRGLERDFYIASAATSTEEIGNGVYPPVRKLLRERGIDTSEKRAIQVTFSDGEKYDYLVCMDSANLRNITRLISGDAMKKVSRLLDFTSHPRDVADPWYTRDFSATERDVDEGCKALLEYILNNINNN